MTLQQIIYFMEIAHTQHFTQAAQNLYVSQSALSYSIQSLEKELGVPLFVRKKSGRKVDLTVYGQTFLPYCETALSNIKEGQSKLENLKNPLSGAVSIMYSYINFHKLIPEMFNDFYKQEDCEDIMLHFSVNHEKMKFEEGVLSGEVDLAFAATKEYEGLETIPIARQKLMIYLAASHPLAKKKKLSLQDIKDEEIYGYYKDSNLYGWLNDMFHKCGLKPNYISGYQDWSSHMAYVSLNLGITIFPDLPVDNNTIAKVEIDHPMNERNLYMLWAKDRPLSEATNYIKKYCMEWSKEHYGVLA